MRFWPFRGRPAQPSADSSAFAIAELAPQLSGVLAVEQVRAEGHALAFGGRLLQSPQAAITSLQPRFRSFGYTPFLQASDGLTWVQSDFGSDGTHPSKQGRQKVGHMLVQDMITSPFAQSWFLSTLPGDAIPCTWAG